MKGNLIARCDTGHTFVSSSLSCTAAQELYCWGDHFLLNKSIASGCAEKLFLTMLLIKNYVNCLNQREIYLYLYYFWMNYTSRILT